MKINERGFGREFRFRVSKSGGSGGQHVNKVMTKVELVFNIPDSQILTDEEKLRVSEKLASKISTSGDLRIEVQDTRSQHENKEISIKRFYEVMEKAMKKPKVRKATKPSKAAKENRQKAKKSASEKKQNRKKISPRSFREE